MQPDAGVVFPQDDGLDGPYVLLLGEADETLKERPSGTAVALAAIDIYAALDHPRVGGAGGKGHEGSPADDLVDFGYHEAALIEMGRIPLLEGWAGQGEGREVGIYALFIYARHGVPVAFFHFAHGVVRHWPSVLKFK